MKQARFAIFVLAVAAAAGSVVVAQGQGYSNSRESYRARQERQRSVQMEHKRLEQLVGLILEEDQPTQRRAVAMVRESQKKIEKLRDPDGLVGAVDGFNKTLYGDLHMFMSYYRMAAGRMLLSEGALKELKGLNVSLATLVDPKKIDDLYDRQAEGSAKGNLGAMRSALSIFYGDKEGVYPEDPARELTAGGKYLTRVPYVKLRKHQRTNTITLYGHVNSVGELAGQLKDTGGFGYVSEKGSSMWGTLVIDCTHKDSRGTLWYKY